MLYRNQTPTLTQISLMARMRITTTQEAVAYLRASSALNTQVAEVLQRASIREQHLANRAPAPTPAPTPEPVQPVEPAKVFVPEDVTSDEGFSEKEVEEKVAKLKAAKKFTKKLTPKEEKTLRDAAKAKNEQPAEKEGN